MYHGNMIYSLQVEKHVLGGLLKHPQVFPEIDPFLTENDFYSKVHSTIYLVIKSCLLAGKNIDKVLVANEIKNLGVSFKDEINIFDYVDNLAFTQITESATQKAAEELYKIRVRRDLSGTLEEAIKFLETNGNNSLDEIVSNVDGIINDKVSSYGIDEEPQNIFHDVEDVIEQIGNKPAEENGYATSFSDFNRYYGGLKPGNLYAVCSRPGQGKTTFLNWIAFQTYLTSKAHPKVLYLDTEMSTLEIKFRLTSALTGVSVWHLETGNWRKNPDMVEKVRAAWPKVKDYSYFHHHVGNKNVDQICSLIRRWHFKHVGRGEPCLIVYDYVKLTGEKVGNNWAEYQAIGDKIDKLKKIAEEINAPLLTAMQLNRSGESATDDSSAIALSDRLQWFATFVAIFRRKTLEEIAVDGEQFGTHKLIPLKSRHQGQHAPGHQDLIRRSIYGKFRYVQNFLNFNVDNFRVDEQGSLIDIVNNENASYEMEDGETSNQGELL